jgi:hypothetical protein
MAVREVSSHFEDLLQSQQSSILDLQTKVDQLIGMVSILGDKDKNEQIIETVQQSSVTSEVEYEAEALRKQEKTDLEDAEEEYLSTVPSTCRLYPVPVDCAARTCRLYEKATEFDKANDAAMDAEAAEEKGNEEQAANITKEKTKKKKKKHGDRKESKADLLVLDAIEERIEERRKHVESQVEAVVEDCGVPEDDDSRKAADESDMNVAIETNMNEKHEQELTPVSMEGMTALMSDMFKNLRTRPEMRGSELF